MKDYDTDSFDDDSFGSRRSFDGSDDGDFYQDDDEGWKALGAKSSSKLHRLLGETMQLADRPFPSALSGGSTEDLLARRDKEIEAQSSLDIECEDADADGGGGGGGGGSANANNASDEEDGPAHPSIAGSRSFDQGSPFDRLAERSKTTAPIPSFCD